MKNIISSNQSALAVVDVFDALSYSQQLYIHLYGEVKPKDDQERRNLILLSIADSIIERWPESRVKITFIDYNNSILASRTFNYSENLVESNQPTVRRVKGEPVYLNKTEEHEVMLQHKLKQLDQLIEISLRQQIFGTIDFMAQECNSRNGEVWVRWYDDAHVCLEANWAHNSSQEKIGDNSDA